MIATQTDTRKATMQNPCLRSLSSITRLARTNHMKQHLKVAIASQNLKQITAHAGRARKFLVFDVSTDGSWQQGVTIKLPKEMAMHDFAGEHHPLYDMDILVIGGCGPGFVKRMQRHDLEVIITSESSPVQAITALAAGETLPPPIDADVIQHGKP